MLFEIVAFSFSYSFLHATCFEFSSCPFANSYLNPSSFQLQPSTNSFFGRNIRKLGATFKEKISILVFLKHKFVPHKIIILPLLKYLLRWHDIFVLWFAGNTYLWNKNASLCSEQLPGMQSNNHGVRVKFKRRCNKNKKQKKVRSVVIVAYQQNE